ncbi:GNAT family N-acetyltransferase [Mucilaginibacter conchicola]|uniref:GNAT family N-acetyltransferase n=1 Tax=Mucilaginibacter conchicola TaxID=2303333 RepID=A0A372NZ27_9SPHI|nr:GNAT family N-acetyltransferase [Mucilaginibacter conchicola]RFZ94919.1 GNAT family N-acetyltransferase [Mucilaginibacter conchicola]
MENIRIARVTIDEASELRQISIDTFCETFEHLNSKENMAHYLKNSLSVEKLTSELLNDGSQFWFAILDDAIIGYLKINTGLAQVEPLGNDHLEIERIYVKHAYLGKKVGQLLYDKAIQIAQDLAANYVWLGVWEDNERAKRFYHKNGFTAFDKHVFKLGDDEQTDILMKKPLNATTSN